MARYSEQAVSPMHRENNPLILLKVKGLLIFNQRGGENMTTVCATMQKSKLLIGVLTLLALLALLFPALSFAAATGESCTKNSECPTGNTCVDLKCEKDPFGTSATEAGLTNLGTKNLVTTITAIINVALGLLGVVAVVIILIGGFKWMTGGGNEDKVGEARKLIFAGIIGLAIILSAWAIAKFVIQSLQKATGSGTDTLGEPLGG